MRKLTGFIAGIILIGTSLVGCWSQNGETASDSGLVLKLTQDNFDSEIKNGVVLVDFWAPWCPPCRVQGPIMDEVAPQVKGRAKVAKINIDEAPAVARRFQVRSIPTLILFKDGKAHQQFLGLTQADALVAAIEGALSSK